MYFPNRSKLLALSAAGVLALSLTGIAVAQDPGGADGPRDERAARRHGAGVVVGLHQIVHASELDGSVFREGFADGLSVNQILEANGLDPAAIKADVLANLEARLAEKVAAGDIDQARADELLATADEQLTRLMAAVPDGDHFPRPIIRLAGAHGIIESAAETLALTVEELVGELRESGGTIADVATANGVDPQVVVDNAVADALAKIDELEAAGTITAERAAEMREKAPERIAEFVNEGGRRHGSGRPE